MKKEKSDFINKMLSSREIFHVNNIIFVFAHMQRGGWEVNIIGDD